MRHPLEAKLWAVLDLLPLGVILAGADRRVEGMNVRGQAMLREADAIRFDGAHVHATDPAVDARLQLMISAGKPALLRLPRLSGRRPAELSIAPLGEGIALMLSDPGRRCVADAQRVRQLYGLTPAESRVLAAVVQGEGSDAAAATLGMSVHTLRRHLKSIFAKLAVDRQSELVKVVTLGAAALGE